MLTNLSEQEEEEVARLNNLFHRSKELSTGHLNGTEGNVKFIIII